MRTKHCLTVVALCAAIAGAAGCGRSSLDITELSTDEISDRAEAALKNAPSLKMTFEGTQSGHLALNKKGDCTGKVTLPEGRLEIIKVDRNVWLKTDGAFLGTAGLNAATVERLTGKYLQMSIEDPNFGDVAAVCDVDKVFEDSSKSGGELLRGKTSTVDGIPVISLTCLDGTTVYIATDGTDYPLKVVIGGDRPETVTFSDFGEPVNVEPPADKLTIDASQLRFDD